ncbi:MAG: hypothetical protein P1U57_00220 [Oleibacter sp.]|nr:hypothetical protein [Thalassolituus sp.]
MKFEIGGKEDRRTLTSQEEYISYLLQECRLGVDLLPLFNAVSPKNLPRQVKTVRFDPPFVMALVERDVDSGSLCNDAVVLFKPIDIKTIAIVGYSEELTAHEVDLIGLVEFCLQKDIGVELGIIEITDTDKTNLFKKIESLEIELESAHEIIKLLINVAKDLAQGSGEQLQEQVVERAAANMLANSAASELAASTEDDLSDMLGSPLGGILQRDIHDEISQQIAKLNKLDQLALSLCEPEDVLEIWVEDQFCSFPTPIYSTDIELSCEQLIDDMAREVENIIHQESDN